MATGDYIVKSGVTYQVGATGQLTPVFVSQSVAPYPTGSDEAYLSLSGKTYRVDSQGNLSIPWWERPTTPVQAPIQATTPPQQTTPTAPTIQTYSSQLTHQLEQQGAITSGSTPVATSTSTPVKPTIPKWKYGSDFDTNIQPTPIIKTLTGNQIQEVITEKTTDTNKNNFNALTQNLKNISLGNKNYSTMLQDLRIAPTDATYTLTGDTTGKVYTKTQMIAEIERRQKNLLFDVGSSVKNYMDITVQNKKLSDTQIKELKKYPSGSQYVYNQATGEIKITLPETSVDQLAWNKTLLNQTSNLPPVLKEINQFGQGLMSDIFSLGSPVAEVLGLKKQYDIATTIGMTGGNTTPFNMKGYAKNLSQGLSSINQGVHYVNPIDYVLEPIGLSPKGSTGLLNKYPAFTIGGIGGEVATFVMGDLAIKGVTTGVSKGVKFVAPRAISSIKTTFPEVASKIVPKMEQTVMGKNFKLWTEGYVPAVRGTEKIVSNEFIRKADATYMKNVFTQSKNRFGIFSEREFISKTNADKLLKPSVELTVTQRGMGLTTTTETVLEKTSYGKGLLGKTKRIYEELRITNKPSYVDYLQPSLEKQGYKPYGSLYNLSHSTKPITELDVLAAKEANPKVKWLYDFVIPKQKGSGIPYIKSTPKFIKKLDTKAEFSMLVKPRPMVYDITTGATKRGLARSTGVSVLLPSSKIGMGVGKYALYGLGKTSTVAISQYQYRPEIYKQLQNTTNISKLGYTQVQKPVELEKILSISKTKDMTGTITGTTQDIRKLQSFIMIPKLAKAKMTAKQQDILTSSKYGFIGFKLPDYEKRSSKRLERLGSIDMKYKFREFNIPSLEKIGRIKL